MRLCIAIPTYNRKEKLRRTLGFLENQTSKEFSVVISDNFSDYDVHSILSTLSTEFRERIHISSNKYNIGMGGNIASLFLKASEDWCWFLADDDYPRKDAVEEIIRDIRNCESENISIIQYPHFNISTQIMDEYTVLGCLDEYIECYTNLIQKGVPVSEVQGTLIYMSNKVFRVSSIKDYIRYSYDYANTGIPQVIPILKALDDRIIKMLIHNRVIVEYNNDGEESWNVKPVALGISTIRNIPFSINMEKQRKLWYLLMIKYKKVLSDYVKMNKHDYDYLKYLYDNMYCEILEQPHRDYYQEVLVRTLVGTEMEYLSESFV